MTMPQNAYGHHLKINNQYSLQSALIISEQIQHGSMTQQDYGIVYIVLQQHWLYFVQNILGFLFLKHKKQAH